MPEGFPEIPSSLIERYAAASAAFLVEVKLALQDAEHSTAVELTAAVAAWRGLLPLLEQQKADIDLAMAHFQIGDLGPILKCAQNDRGLSKHLDGYPLDFAGPDHEQKLTELLKNVVIAAYQLCSAAGIP